MANEGLRESPRSRRKACCPRGASALGRGGADTGRGHSTLILQAPVLAADSPHRRRLPCRCRRPGRASCLSSRDMLPATARFAVSLEGIRLRLMGQDQPRHVLVRRLAHTARTDHALHCTVPTHQRGGQGPPPPTERRGTRVRAPPHLLNPPSSYSPSRGHLSRRQRSRAAGGGGWGKEGRLNRQGARVLGQAAAEGMEGQFKVVRITRSGR